jgi:hypothetical protein
MAGEQLAQVDEGDARTVHDDERPSVGGGGVAHVADAAGRSARGFILADPEVQIGGNVLTEQGTDDTGLTVDADDDVPNPAVVQPPGGVRGQRSVPDRENRSGPGDVQGRIPPGVLSSQDDALRVGR